jgi:N-acetyl sugar amidotransferase
MQNRICSRTVLDDTVPGILYDENGVANYCEIYDILARTYPKGSKGESEWNELVSNIKETGKGNEYDCIIGVSGGTDSCYLLHIANELGLRPLAVNFDNGWSTEISVKNIKKVTSALNIDLETYVVDYDEMKEILKSYMKASFPWIDAPTDIAISGILYRIAAREGIKYVFSGSDFRSEGTQPNEWTHSDSRQLKHIVKTFSNISLKTYPNLSIKDLFYYGYLKGINMIRPFYYIEYKKKDAQQLLMNKYGWQYYGGHHHENIFTKFAIAYWLPKKFGIDKRKITYSALIMSAQLQRDEAIKLLSEPPYDPEQMERDKDYVLKKLDISSEEFDDIWKSENKNILTYPSYFNFIHKFMKLVFPLFKYVLPWKPMMFYQMEVRKKS